jgi:hypothetical protein
MSPEPHPFVGRQRLRAGHAVSVVTDLESELRPPAHRRARAHAGGALGGRLPIGRARRRAAPWSTWPIRASCSTAARHRRHGVGHSPTSSLVQGGRSSYRVGCVTVPAIDVAPTGNAHGDDGPLGLRRWATGPSSRLGSFILAHDFHDLSLKTWASNGVDQELDGHVYQVPTPDAALHRRQLVSAAANLMLWATCTTT